MYTSTVGDFKSVLHLLDFTFATIHQFGGGNKLTVIQETGVMLKPIVPGKTGVVEELQGTQVVEASGREDSNSMDSLSSVLQSLARQES